MSVQFIFRKFCEVTWQVTNSWEREKSGSRWRSHCWPAWDVEENLKFAKFDCSFIYLYLFVKHVSYIYIYTYFSLFLINFDCFQCDFEWFMLRVCHRCCQGTHAVHRPFGPRKTPLAKLPTETRPEVRPSLWQALLCIVNFVLYKCHCCAVGWVFWCIQVVLGCLWLPSALKKVFLLSWSLSLNRSRISSRLVHRRIWQNNQNYSEL